MTFNSSVVVHTGQPNGGNDLCSGQITGCLQFYGMAMDYTAQMMQLIFQSNRQINQLGKNADLPHYQQLRDCLGTSNLVDAILKLLKTTTLTDQPNICTANQVSWAEWGVTGTFEGNVTNAFCIAYNNAFAREVQSCESLLGTAKKVGEDIGIAVGVLAVLVIAFAIYSKFKQSNCSCALFSNFPSILKRNNSAEKANYSGTYRAV